MLFTTWNVDASQIAYVTPDESGKPRLSSGGRSPLSHQRIGLLAVD